MQNLPIPLKGNNNNATVIINVSCIAGCSTIAKVLYSVRYIVAVIIPSGCDIHCASQITLEIPDKINLMYSLNISAHLIVPQL